MVVAHLQGLLPRNHRFGKRSVVTEEIILESLSADLLARNIEAGAAADLALVPALNQQGVMDTVEQSSARLRRASELRLLDIYKVADQISGKVKRANPKNIPSLYQLYQIAEKTGIFDAFDEHYRDEDATPLL